MFTSPSAQAIANDDSTTNVNNEAAAEVLPSLEVVEINIAAKIINRTEGTIYNLVSQKKIPFIRQNRRLFFSRTALLQWMTSQTEVYYPITRREREVSNG